MVFNLVKKSLSAVINSPSINFQLVLYLILINFLALYITSYAKIAYVAFTLLIVTVLLSFVFSSGWLQVIKESTNADEKKAEKNKEKNYFSIFFEGVGKNIVPIAIASIIYTILYVAVIVLTSTIAGALFGDLKEIIKEIAPLLQNPAGFSLNDLLSNLTDNQKYTLYSWQLSFMITSTLFNFIFMFYFPAIIYNNNSNIFIKPLQALADSIRFIFKNFLGSLSVFVLIYSFYIILSILKHFVIKNSFLTILFLFFFICFISSAIMLIFNYYEQKNICSDRTDCLGENKAVDCIGEKD